MQWTVNTPTLSRMRKQNNDGHMHMSVLLYAGGASALRCVLYLSLKILS